VSYREENGLVILTMSRDDYERLLFRLGMHCGNAIRMGSDWRLTMVEELSLMNRLNEGNPHYAPYSTGDSKP